MSESEVVGDGSSVAASPSAGGGAAAAATTAGNRLVSQLGGLEPADHSHDCPLTTGKNAKSSWVWWGVSPLASMEIAYRYARHNIIRVVQENQRRNFTMALPQAEQVTVMIGSRIENNGVPIYHPKLNGHYLPLVNDTILNSANRMQFQ